MINIFQNEKVVIAVGTKDDGIFGNHILPQTEAENSDRKYFLSKLNITDISIIKPVGRFLTFNSEENVIHTIGVISEKKKAYGLLAADCFALIVWSPEDNRIGILHIGWKEICTNSVKRFFKIWFNRYPDCNKESLHFFITPGICDQCFTLTGWKGWFRIFLFKISSSRQFIKKVDRNYCFNLQRAIRNSLLVQGFKEEQIKGSNVCTFENNNLSSHRREGSNRESSNFVVVKMK